MKNKVYFEDAELRVVDIKKGYAIVLESRWHTYGYNAIVERHEMTLSNAKKVKNDLEKEDNLEYLIIDCNDEKYKPIDSKIYDDSSKFERLKKYVQTHEPNDFVEGRIENWHNKGDITDGEYIMLLDLLDDRYTEEVVAFSDSYNEIPEEDKKYLVEHSAEYGWKIEKDLPSTCFSKGEEYDLSFDEVLKLYDDITKQSLELFKSFIRKGRDYLESARKDFKK